MVAALLFNHHPEKPFTVRAGDRIAQVIFMEKFTANFQRMTDKHCLGITKLGSDGFGSTGVSVIKKKKIKRFLQKKICCLFLKRQTMRQKQLLKNQLLKS